MTTLSSPIEGAGGSRSRATMRDVAALAGVSLKTVSRVVNHEAGVSGELIARVERAAEQLDYRPNLTASNLRRSDQRTATVGLLVEDVANEFFASIHRGVEEVARQRGSERRCWAALTPPSGPNPSSRTTRAASTGAASRRPSKATRTCLRTGMAPVIHAPHPRPRNVGIDLRRRDACVPQHHLDGA